MCRGGVPLTSGMTAWQACGGFLLCFPAARLLHTAGCTYSLLGSWQQWGPQTLPAACFPALQEPMPVDQLVRQLCDTKQVRGMHAGSCFPVWFMHRHHALRPLGGDPAAAATAAAADCAACHLTL